MRRGLEAIVFDFDGVIADSERLHLMAYQHVLAPLGLQLSETFYKAELLGYHDRGVFQKYAEAHRVAWDAAAIEHLIRDKTRVYEDLAGRGEMLYPGAAAFISNAAARVPIGIASGALTQEIEDILDRARIRSLFSAIVGADQTTRSKPSPEPYLEAFARLQETSGRALDPQRTVGIEDSKWGLWSAKGAGLRLVAVTTTYPAAEFEGIAELVVPGLQAITLDALDALCETIVA